MKWDLTTGWILGTGFITATYVIELAFEAAGAVHFPITLTTGSVTLLTSLLLRFHAREVWR